MADLMSRQAELKSRTLTQKGAQKRNPEVWKEQHFTTKQLAEKWAMSGETIRRLVQDDPDVIKKGEGETRTRRQYYTYYVPESVASRLHAQLSRKGS